MHMCDWIFETPWSHVSFLWPRSCRPVDEKKISYQWSLAGRECVCVCVGDCVHITAAHVTIKCLGDGKIHPVRLGLITHCPSLQSSSQLHWEISRTFRSLLVTTISHLPSVFYSRLLLLIYCSLKLTPRSTPSPQKMSDNGFTLIKWDSVSAPSQATGNSRRKWNCLRLC